MELKIKKTHSIIIEMSIEEARDITAFLDDLEENGEIRGEDTVTDFNVSLHHQINKTEE